MSLDTLSVSELVDQTFHFYSHNLTYATPGYYDMDIQDVSWILVSTLIFFTMQTGLALIEVGACSPKNSANVMMKNIVDICAGGVSYWIFGFGLMYGRGEYTNAFFGAGDFFVNAKANDPLAGQIFLLFFFQMSFATTSTTIVSGAVAERFKFVPYMLFSFLMTFVYGVGAGWIWGQHGWLKNIGVMDFAGTGPIHIIGGSAAFVAAWFIGPRLGRFDKGTEPLQMGNLLNLCLGLFILWWGWIGFNAGSSYGVTNGKWQMAARAGAGTTLATMAGGLFSIFFSIAKHKGKIDVFEICSGILASLVAINAGCNMFSMYSAFITGVVSSVLCLIAGPIIDKMHIDDAVGAVAVHFVGGIWGELSVGLFADPLEGMKGLFVGGSSYLLQVQAISAFSLTIWSAFSTLIIIWVVNKILPIRMTEEEEIKGADLTEHYQSVHTLAALHRPSLTVPSVTVIRPSMGSIHKINNMPSPIARFTGHADTLSPMDYDSFGRRKPFTVVHDNYGYEVTERK